MDRENMIR